MPTVGRLTREKLTTATLELDGDAVSVTFDRNQVTPAWAAKARELAMEQEDVLATTRALAEIVRDWDITNDDGTPYPPTAENLAVFGLDFQALILKTIVEASSVSRAEGNSSSASSAATAAVEASSEAPSPTSPNGSDTSTSPAVSASPSPT